VISGMGELHLEVKCNMIMNDYKIPVKVGRPKVAYKMTLKGPKTVEARHIKQSGGSGQFAVAKVRFSVDEDGRELQVHRRHQGWLGAARIHQAGR
jgi:elongation factor G